MKLQDKIYFKNKLFKIRMNDREITKQLDRAMKSLERIRDKKEASLKEKEELLQELIDYKNGKSI